MNRQLYPLPRVCRACQGKCALRLVQLLDFPTHARVACPACVGVAGRRAEIPDLTWRDDLPRGAA